MSDLRIKKLVLGAIGTNCYIIYRDSTKEGVIVDPADSADVILAECDSLGVKVQAILLTHGHFDHIMALNEVQEKLQVPVYAGWREEKLLGDPELNVSLWQGCPVSCKADIYVHDGDVLHLIGYDWKVFETPGHTIGSVSYYIESEHVLISGDTLFYESFGRTDFPTGSLSQLIRSIQTKLLILPDETKVYPGHDADTDIAHEKKYNPANSYRLREG